jgi:hypothetical protein
MRDDEAMGNGDDAAQTAAGHDGTDVIGQLANLHIGSGGGGGGDPAGAPARYARYYEKFDERGHLRVYLQGIEQPDRLVGVGIATPGNESHYRLVDNGASHMGLGGRDHILDPTAQDYYEVNQQLEQAWDPAVGFCMWDRFTVNRVYTSLFGIEEEPLWSEQPLDLGTAAPGSLGWAQGELRNLLNPDAPWNCDYTQPDRLDAAWRVLSNGEDFDVHWDALRSLHEMRCFDRRGRPDPWKRDVIDEFFPVAFGFRYPWP